MVHKIPCKSRSCQKARAQCALMSLTGASVKEEDAGKFYTWTAEFTQADQQFFFLNILSQHSNKISTPAIKHERFILTGRAHDLAANRWKSAFRFLQLTQPHKNVQVQILMTRPTDTREKTKKRGIKSCLQDPTKERRRAERLQNCSIDRQSQT